MLAASEPSPLPQSALQVDGRLLLADIFCRGFHYMRQTLYRQICAQSESQNLAKQDINILLLAWSFQISYGRSNMTTRQLQLCTHSIYDAVFNTLVNVET